MELLFSEKGFEQDANPQLCLIGTCDEFSEMAIILEKRITNGEKKLLHIENSNLELSFYNNEGENYIIKKVGEKKFVTSLDLRYCLKLIDLIIPLTTRCGYQFVEFPNAIEDDEIGLIFKSLDCKHD